MDIILRQKISLLINLARADGHFALEEKRLIVSLATEKGLTLGEIDELIESPDSIQTLGALSKERKREYLIDSIRLMLADGKIQDSEMKFCQNLAVKMTYHQSVVDHILDHWQDDSSRIDLTEFELPSF